MKLKSFVMMLTVGVSLLLASCGSSTAPTTYTISGMVYGLSGTGLVLQDNGDDNLSIIESGAFVFATTIVSGGNYNVTILTQPSNPAQTCTVANGSGTANANVSAVQVVCNTNTFTVGVTVTGLSGTGLVLQNNGGNNLSVGANGNYTFSTAIARGSTYNVTVLTQPSGPAQTCGVTNGFGTVTIANASGIQVNCVTTTVRYTIGVAVSGLSGTGLVLEDNGGDNLPVSANGNFTFATAIASGTTYAVTVLTQPSNPAQNCVVTIGSGTAVANVTGIPVTCSNVSANIAVTVSGLSANAKVVLQNEGGDNLAVSTNGTITNFNTPVTKGSPYAVTVLTQPAGAACTLGSNASGTVGSANIGIAVTCGNIIAAGESHTCALTKAGTVWCWGLNEYGQLGNGTLTESSIPVEVLNPAGNAPLGGVVAIATGQDRMCAVTSAGAALCWGDNSQGELGNGATTQSSIPVVVSGLSSGVAAISAGSYFTCAVTNAGAAECWGEGGSGQLGNGTSTNSTIPAEVSGLTSGVAAIAAGESHACALTNAGAVWCWGLNAYGQLGNGTLSPSSIPVEVLDSAGNAPLGGVVAIAAGQDHTCAVTSAGAALCWGDNSQGELGNGASTQSSLPVQVSGVTTGITSISAGSGFTCAVTTAGATQCWGEGGSGQLGNGTAANSATPAQVSGLTGGVVAVAAGASHACAVNSAGAVWCWGLNTNGQLGNDTTTASPVPVQVVGSGDTGFLQLF